VFEGPVQDLIDELGRLPGVGPKSAQRIAFHLLAADPVDVTRLQEVLQKVKDGVRFCEVCGNVSERERCRYCADPRRDPTIVCVVEEPKDVLAVERTREFKGRYHVLGGALDPLAGVGPDALRIRELLARLGGTGPASDETEIAIGIQRALRGRAITACFLEGHGELPMDNFEYHTHLESGAGHSHDDASSQVVEMPGHGAGRLRRALEAQGYEARKLVLATEGDVPTGCTLLVAANPRTTFLPAESAALRAYLRRGGSALLLLDLGFVLEPGLARLVAELGVRPEQEVVVDPLSHYSTNPEIVAVTGYDPHPITRSVSLTFYPGIRPLTMLPPAGDLRVTPLLLSSRDSYTRPVKPVGSHAVEPDPEGGKDAAAPPVPGPRVLGVAVEGRLDGDAQPMRAVVVGDSDFASNSFFPYMANSDLLLSAARWLAREERTTAVAGRVPVAPLIALTGRQSNAGCRTSGRSCCAA